MEVNLRSDVPIFQRERITMGRSGLFVPCSFVSDTGTLTEIVPAKGYRPLVRVRKTPLAEALAMIRDLLLEILAARKHGFIDGEYYIGRNVTFLSEKSRRLQILYFPYRYQNQLAFFSGLCDILAEMQRIIPDYGREYLAAIESCLKEEKRDLKAAAFMCEKLIREARWLEKEQGGRQ